MLLGNIRKHQETTGKNSNQKQTLTVHIIEKQALSGSDHCQKRHYKETIIRKYEKSLSGNIT